MKVTRTTKYGTVVFHSNEDYKEFPKFVRLGKNGSVLRLAHGRTYFRDAGYWSIEARRVGSEGKLVAWVPKESHEMHHVHMTELFPVTEKEWREDNGKWAPMGTKEEQELEYLRWFYEACDFGPAHGDVIDLMNEEFEEQTGKKVPDGYI